jgi:hypothetical protein
MEVVLLLVMVLLLPLSVAERLLQTVRRMTIIKVATV